MATENIQLKFLDCVNVSLSICQYTMAASQYRPAEIIWVNNTLIMLNVLIGDILKQTKAYLSPIQSKIVLTGDPVI